VGTLKGTDYFKTLLIAYLILGLVLETFHVPVLRNLLNLE
jgi:hypothetical protein